MQPEKLERAGTTSPHTRAERGPAGCQLEQPDTVQTVLGTRGGSVPGERGNL